MIKKNTAFAGFGIGCFIKTADGSEITTGTPTCKRLLDGTAGSCSNAASYDSTAGCWKIDLTAADLNADSVTLIFKLTDCQPITFPFHTVTGVPDSNGNMPSDIQTAKQRAVTDVGFGNTVYLGTAAWSTVTQANITGGAWDITHWFGAKGGLPILDASTGLVLQGYGSGSVTVGTVTTVTNMLTADQVWDELLTGATHNIPNSSGRRLRQLAASIVIDGTAVSATSNTIKLDTDASTSDGAYDPSLIYIATGTGAGQCRNILEYKGGTDRIAVVDRNWKVIPSTDSTYVIMGDAGREHVNEGLAQGGGASTITLNALASSTNNAYIAQRVFIRSGTGEDQSRRVVAYNGTTKVATVSRPWDVVPDTTSAYVMLPTGAINDNDIAGAVWDEEMSSHSVSGTFGDTIATNLNAAVDGGTTLASDGLDAIAANEPTGKPTTFVGWVMWLVQWKRRASRTPTTVLVRKEDGTTITTQSVTDDGAGTETLGPPT